MPRASVSVTALLAAAALAFLAWRGLKGIPDRDSRRELRWREADESDLF